MKIREKTNVNLFIVSDSDEFIELSYVNPWDAEWDYNKIIGANGGYMILLPKNKTYSHDFYQCKEITAYVEKIDEINERVYVSQIHWLYMRNIIENRLHLPVKIIKRYPGKLTVAQIVMPGQEINKTAIKALAEEMQEKIYIKQFV